MTPRLNAFAMPASRWPRGRDHPGQGTANRCIFFENGYLELLWVADRGEVTAAITRPTELDRRSRWRETAASPFGIALRQATGTPV